MFKKYYPVKTHVVRRLDEEEAVRWAIWAVGKDYDSISFTKWPERWNQLHPDLFELKESDMIEETLDKMIDAWKKGVKNHP